MTDSARTARPANLRVLIVDDSPAIHADFRKTLAPKDDKDELAELEQELLGQKFSPREENELRLELNFADQGESGARKVKAAAQAGEPYAMAFVDMRMPPGWDGLRTIREMWQADPHLEVVICTAYSDYTSRELFQRLGNSHQLLILKKPFDPVEAMQLAICLTHKWNLAHQMRLHIETLRTTVVEREDALDLLSHQNRAILDWVGQPVVALDRGGRILFVNSAAAEMLHAAEADIGGKSFHEIVHPAQHLEAECHWASWEKIDAAASAGVTTDVFDRTDGTRCNVEFIVTRTRDSNNELAGAVVMFCEVIESTGF